MEHNWKLKLNVSDDNFITTDIAYETDQVLDFDGDPCKDYVLSRDECLESSIHQTLMDKVAAPLHFKPINPKYVLISKMPKRLQKCFMRSGTTNL